MHENLIVNDLRFEAEIDLDAVPSRVAAAYFQKHHAVGRTNRIRGDGQIRQQVRSADAALRGPTVQGSPRRHRCRRRRFRSDGRWPIVSRGRRPAQFCDRSGGAQSERSLHGVGFSPIQRLVGGLSWYCRATCKKNRRTKNDYRRFEHAAIVRMAKPDSSCFNAPQAAFHSIANSDASAHRASVHVPELIRGPSQNVPVRPCPPWPVGNPPVS